MTVRGVLLDIDGVLAVSWKPLPGAVEAVRAIRTARIPVAFLTNTTSRARRDIIEAMATAGFPADDSELVTAGSATAAFLAEEFPEAGCLMLNDGPVDDFAGAHLVAPGAPADVVVIGSAGPSFSWEALSVAARAVLDGAQLVAMHGSTRWQTEHGLFIDGGAYVALLERVTGRDATTIGKPAPRLFTEALSQLGISADEAVMVGDDLESDVLGAQNIGITGLLVRTGKFRSQTLAASADQPDGVLDTVADLPGWLGLG